MKPKYRRAVFVVIYRRENNKIKYLILKRKLHWKGWEFPKGGIEKKEASIKTIRREIKEETGQIPKNIRKYSISGKFKYDKKYKDRPGITGQTYKLFSAELENKKVKRDKLEHSKYKWISFDKAIKKLTWPNQRKCLRVVDGELK